MKILKKGAEADVYLSSWDGKKSVLKIRKEKKYRNPRLDERIRKQRTIREAQLISDVKSFGISTPLIHFVDYKKFSIYMQYVNGKLIRDMDDKSIPKVCLQIGKIVGNLHKNGIMHGDLTTSNFILTRKNLFLIDFGFEMLSVRSLIYCPPRVTVILSQKKAYTLYTGRAQGLGRGPSPPRPHSGIDSVTSVLEISKGNRRP